MAFVHGKDVVVFVNASNYSTYFNNADSTQTADIAETTTFGNSAKTYIPGDKDGTISLGGLFDATADAVLQPLLGGAGFKSCKMFYPAEQNNPLCDSYLIAPNGLEIGISSKGADGANASVKNLKDTIDKLRETDPSNPILTENKKAVEVVEYLGSKEVSAIKGPIELAKKEKLITEQQANILYELHQTRSQAQNIEDYPEMQNIYDAFGFKNDPENLRKFRLRFGLLANVAKMVAAHYNNMPEFQEGGIKLLNQSSIVQAYTFTKRDGDNVVVTRINTIYPPNFQGTIKLDGGKNYTGNANVGKIAFTFKKAK